MSAMRLEMVMNQKLTTELRMAPHIIQSIEILTLPVLELHTFIQKQLESNPVLEAMEKKEQSTEADADNDAPPEKEQPVDDDFLQNFENLERDDWGEFYSQNRVAKRTDEKDKKLEAMQNSADKPISLQDHLFHQFQLCEVPEELEHIGEQIIYNIDSNGYLRYPLEEIIKSISPKPTLKKAQEALEWVQKLEPAGVGAVDIQECLILQLDKEDSNYLFKKELIEKYLYDIYNNKYPKIAKETGREIDEIKVSVASIQRLNPKPGSEHSREKTHFILPDVVVELIEEEYVITLQEDYIPSLRISPYYAKLLRGKEKKEKLEAQTKEFIKKKIESANWVIDAIKQRQNTLYRVVDQLVSHQRDFLEHGLTHLKPLKMQDVADTLNIHVSTVSRAISDKYIQSPRGIFPIKFFFTGSIDKKGGTNESRVSVRQRVQEIIDNEDKSSPLSDEEIADKLKESGLEIARRTVTKYRKSLEIPSSRRRKQY